MQEEVFLRKVALQNYKSIVACEAELQPLTFLSGPNGSGKSNFLDALRFVADSLRSSLEHALRDRGGIGEVRRRSGGRPNHFRIRLEFRLPQHREGTYSFRIGAQPRGGYVVQQEEFEILSASAAQTARFVVENGKVLHSSLPNAPPASPDRLYLVIMSGHDPIRPAFDALSRMGFYNLNPDRIRDLQSPDAGDLLLRDGSNAASVLAQLKRQSPNVKARIEQYLAGIVPGITGIDAVAVGPKETIQFHQGMDTATPPWKFYAANMSDGTLRALGVLLALYQTFPNGSGTAQPLVGIEEPEIALHPAAAAVLFSALQEASLTRQIIVTSHSPDLLDSRDLAVESILAVTTVEGVTAIGPVDKVGRDALENKLYTAGELMRLNQLRPQESAIQSARDNQFLLFKE